MSKRLPSPTPTCAVAIYAVPPTTLEPPSCGHRQPGPAMRRLRPRGVRRVRSQRRPLGPSCGASQAFSWQCVATHGWSRPSVCLSVDLSGCLSVCKSFPPRGSAVGWPLPDAQRLGQVSSATRRNWLPQLRDTVGSGGLRFHSMRVLEISTPRSMPGVPPRHSLRRAPPQRSAARARRRRGEREAGARSRCARCRRDLRVHARSRGGRA